MEKRFFKRLYDSVNYSLNNLYVNNDNNKMTNNKQSSVEWLCLLLSISSFLIFAYDIENDRDFYTWLWLFNAMIFYTNYLKMNWNK